MLRGITVSVDYFDLLQLTLPYNRHHFGSFMVVTSPKDTETQRIARENNCELHITDAFFRNGAIFNKWLALEEGLDKFGRRGYICIMDSDILWPKDLDIHELPNKMLFISYNGQNISLDKDNLCTPFRRMLEDIRLLNEFGLPDEIEWNKFPLHPQQHEYAGYTQIFNSTSQYLPSGNWHQTYWKHAGGADSFFQALWPQEKKIRPPFEVLHLGSSGINWCGRSTPMLDGSIPIEANERRERLTLMMQGRIGKRGDERFRHERLG